MSFVGGHARFVWWVVMVCGSLGFTSHVVSGLAVVVHGQSYSFCVMVGGGHGWVCSLLFVDFDRGAVVVVCGWLSPFSVVVGSLWVVGAAGSGSLSAQLSSPGKHSALSICSKDMRSYPSFILFTSQPR